MEIVYFNWWNSTLSNIETFFKELSPNKRTRDFILSELKLLDFEINNNHNFFGARLQHKPFHKCRRCHNTSSYIIFITHPNYSTFSFVSTYSIEINDHCDSSEIKTYELNI